MLGLCFDAPDFGILSFLHAYRISGTQPINDPNSHGYCSGNNIGQKGGAGRKWANEQFSGGNSQVFRVTNDSVPNVFFVFFFFFFSRSIKRRARRYGEVRPRKLGLSYDCKLTR